MRPPDPNPLPDYPRQATNTQLARYLYYMGRIKALQLEYTEAHRCLLQAQRKAPTSKGLGFRLTVYKVNLSPTRKHPPCMGQTKHSSSC